MLNCIGRKAGRRGTGDTDILRKSVGSLTCLDPLGLDVLVLDTLRAFAHALEAISGASLSHDECFDNRRESR